MVIFWPRSKIFNSRSTFWIGYNDPKTPSHATVPLIQEWCKETQGERKKERKTAIILKLKYIFLMLLVHSFDDKNAKCFNSKSNKHYIFTCKVSYLFSMKTLKLFE